MRRLMPSRTPASGHDATQSSRPIVARLRGQSPNSVRPVLLSPVTEVVRIGFRPDLPALWQLQIVPHPVLLGVRHRFLLRGEGEMNLRLRVRAADPPHQRVGNPRSTGLELQHPMVRPGTAGLHCVFRRLIYPGPHRRPNSPTVVGAAGFEPAASCTQNTRADQAAPRPEMTGRNLWARRPPCKARPRGDQGALPKMRCATLSPTRMFSRAVVPAASSSVARTGPRLSITARLCGTVFSAIARMVASWLMNTMSSGTSVFFIHICERRGLPQSNRIP